MKTFPNNKSGIELSINFLVILILSLVMLTLGITLMKQFFTTTEDIRTELDVRTEEELSKMLESGQLVAIGFNRKEIGTGQQGIYGLGIMSLREGRREFSIGITPNDPAGYTPSNTEINNPNTNDWLRYDNQLILEENEQGNTAILIQVPPGTQKGTYVFNIQVTVDGENAGNYDTIKKFYVVV